MKILGVKENVKGKSKRERNYHIKEGQKMIEIHC